MMGNDVFKLITEVKTAEVKADRSTLTQKWSNSWKHQLPVGLQEAGE